MSKTDEIVQVDPHIILGFLVSTAGYPNLLTGNCGKDYAIEHFGRTLQAITDQYNLIDITYILMDELDLNRKVITTVP